MMKWFKKHLKFLLMSFLVLITSISYALTSVEIKQHPDSTNSVDVVNQKLRTIAQDYLDSIAESEIPGHVLFTLNGSNPVINTQASVGEQIMWGVAPATQAQYVYPTAATTVTMVSDDATDNQAGVGARAVLITGLLAGYVEDTETLAMHATDGTVAVTSAKSWLRINAIEVTVAGSSAKNAGNITILDSGNILMYMEEGTNKSLQGTFTVPVGKSFYVNNGKGSCAGTKNVHVHIYQRLFGGLFTQEEHRVVKDSPFELTKIRFPEKTDIEVRVHADVNGGIADVSLEGWIEEE